MLGGLKNVALFGRFTLLPRGDVIRLLENAGASQTKDLTRSTDLLAIGAGAANLISGPLPNRLAQARARAVPAMGEARLLEVLRGEEGDPGTLDLASVSPGETDLPDLLNAFDLIRLTHNKIRFSDTDTLRTALALAAGGAEPTEVVSALFQRRQAPKGRHRLELDAQGVPILVWEDGVSAVSGQTFLPLGDGDGLNEVFEEALEAETSGDLNHAARLYRIATRHDRKDAIAPFNLGNVLLSTKEHASAQLAFQTAIARRPGFPEAHYNLAITLEEQGKPGEAMDALRTALRHEKDYPDALFNLAQLELASESHSDALDHFRRFLSAAPNHPLAPSAERAVTLLRSVAPTR